LAFFVCFGQVIAAPPELPTAYYGKLEVNGELAPVGTVVSAWIDNEKYAEFVVHTKGYYGLLPVNGDDISSEKKDGGVRGDLVRFEINGHDVTQLIEWKRGGENVEFDIDLQSSEGVLSGGSTPDIKSFKNVVEMKEETPRIIGAATTDVDKSGEGLTGKDGNKQDSNGGGIRGVYSDVKGGNMFIAVLITVSALLVIGLCSFLILRKKPEQDDSDYQEHV